MGEIIFWAKKFFSVLSHRAPFLFHPEVKKLPKKRNVAAYEKKVEKKWADIFFGSGFESVGLKRKKPDFLPRTETESRICKTELGKEKAWET